MRIYIIRHGETEWNKEEIFRGRKDIPLNMVGKRQAEGIGLYFSERHINRILSSPLARATQTAEPISRMTGAAVEAMEEFNDINFGIWEGLPLREVEECYPSDLALWMKSPEKLWIEGGESLSMVRERISGGFQKIASGEEGTIAVVTHRVICKLIVLHFLMIENEHFWDMKFDPASITLLERHNNQFTLVFSNDTCHEREMFPSAGYRDF